MTIVIPIPKYGVKGSPKKICPKTAAKTGTDKVKSEPKARLVRPKASVKSTCAAIETKPITTKMK